MNENGQKSFFAEPVLSVPLDHQPAVVLFEKAEALELPGRDYMTRSELIEALKAC